MKIIVAGTRTFNDYNLVNYKLTKFNNLIKIDEIVCGGCKGADQLGYKWAKDNNKKTSIFNADWNLYGAVAGPIRNKKMAEYSDLLILFWDGKSKGSLSMLNNMKKLHKPSIIIYY